MIILKIPARNKQFLNISNMVHVRIMHATLYDLFKILVELYMICQECH